MQLVQVEPRMDKGTSEGTPGLLWGDLTSTNRSPERDTCPLGKERTDMERRGAPAVTLGLFGCSGSRPGGDLGCLQLSSPGLQAEATLAGVRVGGLLES